MTRELVFAVIAAVAALALFGMWWGWRRRARRDGGLVAPTDVPSTGSAVRTFDGFYVATTRRGDPLDRLAIRHLAFRGRLTATVRTDGLLFEIPGEPAVFIERAALLAVGRATWTIDRVVEQGGLAAIAWRVDDVTEADTYLRLRQPGADEFVDAVRALLPTQTPTGSES